MLFEDHKPEQVRKFTIDQLKALEGKSKEEIRELIRTYYCYSSKVDEKDLCYLMMTEEKDSDVAMTAFLTLLVRNL